MKILALADVESKYYWDYFEKTKLEGIDLILSCGDLDPNYLSFLATFTQAPLLYVHGNHDTRYKETPPEGCCCIENKIYNFQGIRILGLGGSMRYGKGEHQYTEGEMRNRVRKLWLTGRLRKGVDILLTHSPAYGIHDGKDLPHQGYRVFEEVLRRYQPRFFVHGHVHLNYGRGHQRHSTYQETQIINAYQHWVFDF